MLLINKEGKIIGFNDEKDNKPAPFPIDETYWDGSKWIYPEFKEPESLQEYTDEEIYNLNFNDCIGRPLRAHDILSRIHNLNRIQLGTYIKPKEKEISVLITSYKKSQWVKDAIQSCVNQTMKPFQIIVLSMTDEDYTATLDAMNSFSSSGVSIVNLKNEQLNASAARNLLVKLCKTEYFIHLDADDLLDANFIEETYNEDESVVLTYHEQMVKDEVIYDRLIKPLSGNLTFLCNKELWNDIGGLLEELGNGGEDSYFLNEIYIKQKFKIGICYKTKYIRRSVDEESLSKGNKFYLSKEKELVLHYESYLKVLNEINDIPEIERNYLYSTLNYFYNKIINKQEDDDTIIEVSTLQRLGFVHLLLDNECVKFFNKNKYLFAESRLRDTNYVCYDKSVPNLYGKKFDLYIYSKPGFSFYNIETLKGCSYSCYYKNNPNIDMSQPLVEILKKYCVIFDDKNTQTNTKAYLPKNAGKTVYNIIKDRGIDPLSLSVFECGFIFFYECNKNCEYCAQKDIRVKRYVDDEQLYKNFCEMMDKFESLYGTHWIPQILGGEPTLMSDWLIEHIMDRLKNYPTVKLLTNGLKYGTSKFYKYPNIEGIVHFCDDEEFDGSFLRPQDSPTVIVSNSTYEKTLNALRNSKFKKDFVPKFVGMHKNLLLSDIQKDTIINECKKLNYIPGIQYVDYNSCDVYLCSALRYKRFTNCDVQSKKVNLCCGVHSVSVDLDDYNKYYNKMPPCEGSTCEIYYF